MTNKGRRQKAEGRRKNIQIIAQRHVSFIILLVLFFSAAVLPPTFAYTTTENSIIQNLPNAQELVQQGKNLYEAERFSEAVKILQQAVTAFKAVGDKLNQAMTLGNLSLAYQQLGQWNEAEKAIASSLNLLGYSEQRGEAKNSQIQNLQILAQVLDVKGRLQLARGQTELALTTWGQAADIYLTSSHR